MSSPLPPVGLAGSCSVVHDDNLFVYSNNAFQSLGLANGTQWQQLPNGVPVTGAVCVKGSDNGTGEALWVVGGAAQDDSYPGLQMYSFVKQVWSTITPVTRVTQNRRSHAAVYLPASQSILIYAGSQDDPSQYSIQTFAVSTKAPFNVLSYASKTTPVIQPLLLPWNATSAITVGGKQGNRGVYLFSTESDGWREYGTALARAPKSSNLEQGTLVTGSDGSKVLELYDMSVSPNVVSRFVLQDAGGRPAPAGTTVGQSNTTSTTQRRDLSLSNWPSYNSTAAPTYTRSGFSLAQNDAGLVALSGGNDQHPVALFNQQQNTWVDSTKFFGLADNNDQSYLGPTTTAETSAIPSATAAPSPTSSALPPLDGDHPKTSVILGAVLGSILGLILLLIIALFLLRQRRKREAAAHAAEDGEKPRLSFADRGAPYMMETHGGLPYSHQDPHSSVAIIGMAGHKRGIDSRGSQSSTSRLVPKKDYPPFNESVEMGIIREKADPSRSLTAPKGDGSSHAPSSNSGLLQLPKRTSGWSRYFSGNNDALAAGSSARKSGLSRKSLGSSRASSSYTQKSHQSFHDCNTHGPTEIPPLEMGNKFEEQRVSDALSGTPQSSPSHQATEFGEKARPDTMSSHTSSEMSSNPPSTLGDTVFTRPYEVSDETNRWSPVTKSSDWLRSGLRDTNASSVYTSNEFRSPTFPNVFGDAATSSSSRPVTRGHDVGAAAVAPDAKSTLGASAAGASVRLVDAPRSRGAVDEALPSPKFSLLPPEVREARASNASSSTGWSHAAATTAANENEARAPDAGYGAPPARQAVAVTRKPTPGAGTYLNSPSPTPDRAPMNPFFRSASPAQSLREGQFANASLASRLGAGAIPKPSSFSDTSRESDASSYAWPMPSSNGTASNERTGAATETGANLTARSSMDRAVKPTAPATGLGLQMASAAAPPERKPATSITPEIIQHGNFVGSGKSVPSMESDRGMTAAFESRFHVSGPTAGPSTGPSMGPSTGPSTGPTAGLSMGQSTGQEGRPDGRGAQAAPKAESYFDMRPPVHKAREVEGIEEPSSLADLMKPPAAAAPSSSTQEAKTGQPIVRPAPAQRASIVEIDDSDDDDFEEPVIVTASSNAAPTALTAIPVPASTAMKFTVKKPAKAAPSNDMSWVSLK